MVKMCLFVEQALITFGSILSVIKEHQLVCASPFMDVTQVNTVTLFYICSVYNYNLIRGCSLRWRLLVANDHSCCPCPCPVLCLVII